MDDTLGWIFPWKGEGDAVEKRLAHAAQADPAEFERLRSHLYKKLGRLCAEHSIRKGVAFGDLFNLVWDYVHKCIGQETGSKYIRLGVLQSEPAQFWYHVRRCVRSRSINLLDAASRHPTVSLHTPVGKAQDELSDVLPENKVKKPAVIAAALAERSRCREKLNRRLRKCREDRSTLGHELALQRFERWVRRQIGRSLMEHEVQLVRQCFDSWT